MRVIERLLERAKHRPRPELLGVISPWGDKWYFSLHKTTGRYSSYKGKHKNEEETKAFDFRDDAIKYAESVMKGEGQLLKVGFIDMEGKQTPFTKAEKEAAGIETD